jgi:hypothetical protein
MSLWIDDYRSLIEFFSVAIICAPDRFFKEDFLKDNEQLTLDRAFDELRHGLHFATDRIADKDVVAQIHAGLETAYAAYQAGQTREGSCILQEVEKLVITSVRRPRGK